MWGKVMGKVIDVCLASGLVSLSALVVVRAVKEIKTTIKGEKTNAGNP